MDGLLEVEAAAADPLADIDAAAPVLDGELDPDLVGELEALVVAVAMEEDVEGDIETEPVPIAVLTPIFVLNLTEVKSEPSGTNAGASPSTLIANSKLPRNPVK